MNISGDHLKFDENGLIPAIVQDAISKEVLTLAYMNKEAFQKTLTGETWFYSRSRQSLWHKGETSGNTQQVVSIRFDCDRDALLIQVVPKGPACHSGSYSCFGQDQQENFSLLESNRFWIIGQLEKIIAERRAELPENSYATYLFKNGLDKILKKGGEECSEVIIAAKNGSLSELRHEVADLFFHLLVLLQQANLPFDEILCELQARYDKKTNHGSHERSR
jgi:phosphoribosyl-AMP cyclohydrolase / phosphoribosyl-ATP pyrophosphohydrolase